MLLHAGGYAEVNHGWGFRKPTCVMDGAFANPPTTTLHVMDGAFANPSTTMMHMREVVRREGSGVDATTSRLSAMAPPTKMDAFNHSVGVGFRTLSVRAGSFDMLVTVVSALDDAPEALAIGGDTPGLAEEFSPRGCCLAFEAVHATIKVEGLQAPTRHGRLDVTVAPVQTTFRPLYSDTPPVSTTAVGNGDEVTPEYPEDATMLANLLAGFRPQIPVKKLVG